MKITSSAFTNNGLMPKKYSCEGIAVSPPLRFEDVPAKAKSLALIMDDPDAVIGTFVHWVVFNIPPSKKGFAEGESAGIIGSNTAGRRLYFGPCPPTGIHRYFFKLYALDAELKLKEGASKEELESAMRSHVIVQAELIGLYKRG